MAEVWTMGEMLVEIMRPEADMELDKTGTFLGPYPSGAPAIVIDTVARLGHTSGIFGGVGQDDFGKNILDRLKKDGVDIRFVNESTENSTAVAFVTYFADGSRKFIYHIGNTPAVCPKPFTIDEVGTAKYFHIMGCSLMASSSFKEKILDTARLFLDNGAKLSLDPNIRLELLGGRSVDEVLGGLLSRCSVVMPGVEELRMLTGKETVEEGIKALFAFDTMEVVALKKGSKGCTLYSRSEKVDVGAYKIVQVDPTGAGDCFDAALLCGLIEGKSLHVAGRMASAAGALGAMKQGPMEGDISIETIAAMMNSKQ
jgi:sugar/nucleoside kinase (ribokinase family)